MVAEARKMYLIIDFIGVSSVMVLKYWEKSDERPSSSYTLKSSKDVLWIKNVLRTTYSMGQPRTVQKKKKMSGWTGVGWYIGTVPNRKVEVEFTGRQVWGRKVVNLQEYKGFQKLCMFVAWFRYLAVWTLYRLDTFISPHFYIINISPHFIDPFTHFHFFYHLVFYL